ncbi:hypothetical protein GJ496_000096 [Pomphorhynchus laevis]|nr:hypothetical protein GJ496_000096 [Pomphorhynchus laevis]
MRKSKVAEEDEVDILTFCCIPLCCKRDQLHEFLLSKIQILRQCSKRFPCFAAWASLIAGTCAYYVFVFPSLLDFPISVHICHVVIVLFGIVNFLVATFIDPGYFSPASKDECHDDDFRSPLFKSVEINGILVRMKWCSTCQFYRPPRSSHCSSCDACIENFDHHCPWINNCVGRRNYRYFIMFLLTTTVHMLLAFVFCIYFVIKNIIRIRQITTICTVCLIILIVVLIIPVGGLSGFHLVLIARARTTNEQVTGKFKADVNPFNRGVLRNYLNIFCASINNRKLSSNVADSEASSIHYSSNKIKDYNRFKSYKERTTNCRIHGLAIRVNENNPVDVHNPVYFNASAFDCHDFKHADKSRGLLLEGPLL